MCDYSQRATEILQWYDVHARDLPWRTLPSARAQGAVNDPYRVWLSEVMLQQTTVAAVKDYFLKFTTHMAHRFRSGRCR